MNNKVLCILIALLFSGFCLSEDSLSSRDPIKDQFYRAAKAGKITEIRFLKRLWSFSTGGYFDINDASGSGLQGPALNIAVYERDIKAVRILLDEGADIQIEGYSEGFPLNIAARNGDVEMIRLLHFRGGDVNAVNRSGYAPIHSTAWFGHLEALKVLNELGADIHKKVTDNGESLLHLVARANHPEFIEFLVLHFRIDVNVRSRLGYTPLHDAIRTWSFESVKKLVELGADIYVPSGKAKHLDYKIWDTPLGLVIKSEHVSADIKEFLMQVHQQNKQERSMRALAYEALKQVSDSSKKGSKQFSNLRNSCRSFFRLLYQNSNH